MAGDQVTITSRDRVLFPDSGQTKGDVADYYAAVAPLLLRHAAGRPLSLVRCPQGTGHKCFFQRHDTGGFGPHPGRVAIREKGGEIEDYLYLADAAGLRECVQMGTIEFHLWSSRVPDIELPDRLVIDLDPGEWLGFVETSAAAVTVRDELARHGLAAFAMVTGGKGVHVVCPLTRGHGWDRHAAFAKGLAQALAEREPDRFVAVSDKGKREGRVFLDYLRNQRGNSAVAPYSLRARKGAPVAAPVTWDELPGLAGAAAFSIADVDLLARRAASADLAGWGEAEQALPDAFTS